MKKYFLMGVALLACISFVACSKDDNDGDNGNNGSDDSNVINERVDQWGECMRGDNQTLKAFPDTYAFYWEYTFDVTANPNIGLRIEGEYPNARFFNYNVYDDDLQYSNLDDYSIMDTEITPNSGSVNPFIVETSTTHQKYTVYIVPDSIGDAWAKNHKNTIRFEHTAKKAATFLRYYLPSPLVFGGVSMPNIVAFDVTTGSDVSLPKREISGIHNGINLPGGAFPKNANMLFFRAPFSMMYPNSPSEYAYCRNQMMADSVMFFNFKAPSFPKKVSEYATADMRYWSVSIGGEDTYCYSSISDSDTKIDANGMANFVVIDKNSKNYDALVKFCTEKGYNVLEWNRQAWKAGVMIFYRNMVYNDSFEHSIRKNMEPYSSGTLVPTKHIAAYALGVWGPTGKQVAETEFLQGNVVLRQQ